MSSSNCVLKNMATPALIFSVLVLLSHAIILRVLWKRCIKNCDQFHFRQQYIILFSLSVVELQFALVVLTFMLESYNLSRMSKQCEVLRSSFTMLVHTIHLASSGYTVMLSIDRYISVVYCFRYPTFVTKRRVIIMLITIWMISIFVTGITTLEKPVQSKFLFMQFRVSLQILYAITIISGILILVYIHSYLYIKAKAMGRPQARITESNTRKEEEVLYFKLRTLKTKTAAGVISISYTLCYFPVACAGFLFRYTEYEYLENITGPLTMLNAVLDPLIYTLTTKNIREGLIREKSELLNWMQTFTMPSALPSIARERVHPIEIK